MLLCIRTVKSWWKEMELNWTTLLAVSVVCGILVSLEQLLQQNKNEKEIWDNFILVCTLSRSVLSLVFSSSCEALVLSKFLFISSIFIRVLSSSELALWRRSTLSWRDVMSRRIDTILASLSLFCSFRICGETWVIRYMKLKVWHWWWS